MWKTVSPLDHKQTIVVRLGGIFDSAGFLLGEGMRILVVAATRRVASYTILRGKYKGQMLFIFPEFPEQTKPTTMVVFLLFFYLYLQKYLSDSYIGWDQPEFGQKIVLCDPTSFDWRVWVCVSLGGVDVHSYCWLSHNYYGLVAKSTACSPRPPC